VSSYFKNGAAMTCFFTLLFSSIAFSAILYLIYLLERKDDIRSQSTSSDAGKQKAAKDNPDEMEDWMASLLGETTDIRAVSQHTCLGYSLLYHMPQ